MRPVKAGRMRHQVTLQRRVITGEDEHGAELSEWVDYLVNRWAEIDTGPSREMDRARTAVPEVTHLIKIRHVDGLSPQAAAAMRIKWGASYLDILGAPIDRSNERRELIFNCIEVLDT